MHFGIAISIASISNAGRAAELTLAAAAAEVLETNPHILGQKAATDILKARLSGARASYAPTFNADGSVERRRLNVVGAAGDATFTIKQANIESRLPLFQGFRLRAAVEVRRHELEGGLAGLDATRQSMLLDLVTAYADAARDEAIVANSRDQRDAVNRQVEATMARLRQGEATKTDQSQAEARRASADSAVLAAEEELQVSLQRLSAIVGRRIDTLSPVPEMMMPTGTFDEVLAEARRANPVLEAARSNADAANSAVGLARNALLPGVDLAIGAQALSGGVPNLFSGALPNDRTAVYGGVQLQVPIFQGGVEYAEIKRAKAARSQRLYEVDSADREVVETLSDAWARAEGAAGTIRAAEAAVSANRRAEDGVRKEAIGGSRTLLDVLNAVSELRDAEIALERAKRNRVVAVAAILATLGRLSPAVLSESNP